VADCLDSQPVASARIFILADDGKQIGEAVTDENGQADLPLPRDSDRPRFIIVQHPRFFLGGVEWKAGFTERYIKLAWLAAL